MAGFLSGGVALHGRHFGVAGRIWSHAKAAKAAKKEERRRLVRAEGTEGAEEKGERTAACSRAEHLDLKTIFERLRRS
jgi:hypothetical protein